MKGRCTICGVAGKLTRDHVPPRGVAPPTSLEVSRITALLEHPPSSAGARRAFQAPQFPTLCTSCNTDRLGKLYDPALIVFCDRIRRWFRMADEHGISMVGDIHVDCDAPEVARAVVGHLLAAEERSDPNALTGGDMSDALRAFFLDPDAPWPGAFTLSAWPYPGTSQVLMRGFGISRVLGTTYGPIVGDLLKFFPIAFWVTASPPEGIGFRMASISSNWEGNALRLPATELPPSSWPEHPKSDEVVVLNDTRTSLARPTH